VGVFVAVADEAEVEEILIVLEKVGDMEELVVTLVENLLELRSFEEDLLLDVVRTKG
jgi:hypothetical protein